MRPPVSERYFAPEEVATLIPALTETMGDMMAAHREAGTVRDEMRQDQQRIGLAGGAALDQAAWQGWRVRLEALGARVQAGMEAIAGLGGATKDLDLGLVDFPHLRDGRVVNLCWKHGEREIRFWHGLDEGFAARKPL